MQKIWGPLLTGIVKWVHCGGKTALYVSKDKPVTGVSVNGQQSSRQYAENLGKFFFTAMMVVILKPTGTTAWFSDMIRIFVMNSNNIFLIANIFTQLESIVYWSN